LRPRNLRTPKLRFRESSKHRFPGTLNPETSKLGYHENLDLETFLEK
jgi:hypothetical protein